MAWKPTEITDLSGKTAIVTGANSGIGFVEARTLAEHGAHVILAVRNVDAGRAAAARINGSTAVEALDLASQESVREFAARIDGPVDLLVNNAGVMAPPYTRTVDGFELQMATNHLGPFLLTGLLLDQLVASADGRVVTVSSLMHRRARRAPLGDPRVRRGRYLRWPEYAQTKLANLLFTHELQRRLDERDLPVRALAAHPGLSGTHLMANGTFGRPGGGAASILDAAVRAVSQSAADGALPTLMAATADLPGGTYCGPSGLHELGGPPRVVGCSRLARDAEAARRLWEVSEEAVGLHWP